MKVMKVIIDDPVARISGGEEVELRPTDRIRFEFGETKISCSISENGFLEVSKIAGAHCPEGVESRLQIYCDSSNRIFAK